MCLCVYECARGHICVFIYYKELAHVILGASNLKFVGQAGRLDIQVRVNVAILLPY